MGLLPATSRDIYTFVCVGGAGGGRQQIETERNIPVQNPNNLGPEVSAFRGCPDKTLPWHKEGIGSTRESSHFSRPSAMWHEHKPEGAQKSKEAPL